MAQEEEHYEFTFQVHQDTFHFLLGPSPSISILCEVGTGHGMFHEACVYHPPDRSIFITSNQLPLPKGETNSSTADKEVRITRVHESQSAFATCTDVTPSDLVMANGGVNYRSGIIFCAQGNMTNSSPAGLVYIENLEPPYRSRYLLSSFHGRQFNSLNDVVIQPHDGGIWFTDPCYGHSQGFRPPPELPSQVYRFDPGRGSVRAVADDFVRPNGLCFSPDFTMLYVTDTGAICGAEGVHLDKTGRASIYAFDVLQTRDGPFLGNRRLFAYADTGCPDGIKCDMGGNVYSGCGDGVNVWNPGGMLIGKILVQGGVANFCFGEKGAMYLCNETRLWKLQLSDHVRGALLNI